MTARELLIELSNIAPSLLAQRRVSFEDILTTPEADVAFIRSMPSTDVAIELKTAWHRNRDKQWTANDIYDVDAMALAASYADIVVTEKARHHALIAGGIDKRLGTVVLRDLGALPSAIEGWTDEDSNRG